ncbi:MAG: polysaccharide biosynthesis protein [Sphingomonadaceae bacterium]
MAIAGGAGFVAAPSAPGCNPLTGSRGEVARGAGLAGLARGGAAIEAIAQPLYVWLFGLSTYGVYAALWGGVNFITNIVNLSLPMALQRIVPSAEAETRVHAAVKIALIASVVPALLVTGVIHLFANRLADLFYGSSQHATQLADGIALFAWALPLWTFVEVATAAVRARRRFGAEIRIRIFWEQLARLLFAAGFYFLGLHVTGLLVAHLCSLMLVAVLSWRLLGRHYDLRLLVRAPMPVTLVREVLLSGLALLPSNLSRRALIDAPPLLLNLLIPGGKGAAAAGLFEIGRKISTIPHIVRQSFQYVLAPFAAAGARANRQELKPLYHFAARASAALVVPLAGLVVFAGPLILRIYVSEAAAALPVLIILAGARAVEAIAGPATTLVEMVGHRALPTLNSTLAILAWLGVALWLVPDMGATGMALAVAAGILTSSYAALLALQVEGLSPFDHLLARGLAISLPGVCLMGVVQVLVPGIAGLVLLISIWAISTWGALRFGLAAEDRAAFGSLSRRLRLV